VTLMWVTDTLGLRVYSLFYEASGGQTRMVDTFEQGPFDTSLEVAQWVWREVSKLVPPASC
jgi:hypothetical protein